MWRGRWSWLDSHLAPASASSAAALWPSSISCVSGPAMYSHSSCWSHTMHEMLQQGMLRCDINEYKTHRSAFRARFTSVSVPVCLPGVNFFRFECPNVHPQKIFGKAQLGSQLQSSALVVAQSRFFMSPHQFDPPPAGSWGQTSRCRYTSRSNSTIRSDNWSRT